MSLEAIAIQTYKVRIAELKLLIARCVTSLEWLVPDMQHRSDECRNNLESASQGGYSPELTDAINLLAELKGK